MATYELPLSGDLAPPVEAAQAGGSHRLSDLLLARNAVWFCGLRCVVVVILALAGLLGMHSGLADALGLHRPGRWLLIAAGGLLATNALFFLHARRLLARPSPRRIQANLWGQIISDLLVLTAVVHFVGSIGTFISFAYLFHIVLACIFFSRAHSLVVTLVAIAMFGACVGLEQTSVIRTGGIVAAGSAPQDLPVTAVEATVGFLSAAGIWLTVWFLASHLSTMVRIRDEELAATNERLVAAQAERARHMLVTTHQLKSPFAAIYSNAQVLLNGYCGDLPEPALDVVRRILARCKRLATEIQEMLQLANLSSTGQGLPDSTEMDMAELIRATVTQIELIAQGRGITIDQDLTPVRVTCVEDHLKMLLLNLVANAVNYSRDGGRVRLTCREDAADGGAVVSIADEGIGIRAKMLPRIFDEHFRTKEALVHNKNSSGLGLAIVRQIAELHGIRLSVQSAQHRGTTFTLHFPREMSEPAGQKGNERGLPADSR